MSQYWAVIPAAGQGSRLRSASPMPKQYQLLAGRTMLEHSLQPFLSDSRISGVIVALAPDDVHWRTLAVARNAKVTTVAGGAQRADSVLAALAALAARAADSDWVLVHDAARPCFRSEELDRMLTQLSTDQVGGLLALPARDTLKQSRQGSVASTLDRSTVWQAQTPQMFRLGLLKEALQAARASGTQVTDDAAAIERLGHAPRLVEGRADNFKVTTADDLQLAALVLESRKSQ